MQRLCQQSEELVTQLKRDLQSLDSLNQYIQNIKLESNNIDLAELCNIEQGEKKLQHRKFRDAIYIGQLS